MSNYGNPPSDPYGQTPQDPAGAGATPHDPHATPVQDPYGQASPGAYGQNPYGQNPYGQNPYGEQAYGQQGQGIPQGASYASWGQRVGGALIDGLVTVLAFIPAVIGFIMLGGSVETTTDPATGAIVASEATAATGPAIGLIALGMLLGLAFVIWNVIIRQGNTGYSIGKGVMGIKLVKLQTGEPIGAGMAFVRYLVTQAISSFTCGVGGLLDVLWPLWDDKNQTLHDKVISSVVINQPKS